MTGQSHRLLALKALEVCYQDPWIFLFLAPLFCPLLKTLKQASLSRGVSVSPLSAQVIPCPQLVGGGKVLDSFRPIVARVHQVCFSQVRKFQGAVILFKRPDVFADLGVGSPFKEDSSMHSRT